jgi:prepilin-type N-terminal cleavage/methylation domain-containing protein
MQSPRAESSHRIGHVAGFTLIELLVVIAIIALLIGILLPALGEARKSGRLTIDQANEKQLATAMNSYTADYQDKIASFTVIAGRSAAYYAQALPDDPSVGLVAGDLRMQATTNDLTAASAQAVYILRKRADRGDIAPIDGWIPHVLYSHLVLQDYLASRLPERLVVSPMDRPRLLWQTSPKAFDAGAFPPSPADGMAGDNTIKRWPYSSSYEFVPYSYCRDRADGGAGGLTQAPLHYQYYWSGQQGTLGRRKLGEVDFPSQKVFLFDSIARYVGKRQLYYGYADARPLMAMFDGSVSLRLTGTPDIIGPAGGGSWGHDANPGFNPAAPSGAFPTTFAYQPRGWEPPNRSGAASMSMMGFYRWTRGGLKGVDFGGREVRGF